jgi:hypothetical protein
MINPNEFVQLKAFARQDGTFLGLMWIASFACYVGEFHYSPLGMLAMILAVISPFFLVMRLKKFRDNVRDGEISFRRAFWYCLFCFFYASLLFALSQYVYFAFIDNGFLVQQYNTMMSTPEAKQLMNLYKVANEMEDGISAFARLTAIEKALNFLTMNITIGFILSFPIAAIMKSKVKLNNNQE